jgi:hypothetical protein
MDTRETDHIVGIGRGRLTGEPIDASSRRTRTSLVPCLAIALTSAAALGLTACGDDDDAGDAVRISFEQPPTGTTVAGGIDVVMAAEGITIEEAGEVRDGAGHFHVIADAGCVEPGTAIPRDGDHTHFGGGQGSGTIYLEPGSHELCLQVADGAHVALSATDTITVEVGIADRDEWCAVVAEVDELFASPNLDGEDFAVVQVTAEQIRRLVEQLQDALDQVDSGSRAGVQEALDFASGIVTAIVEAEDAAELEAAGDEIWAAGEDERFDTGAAWILDNCDVDVGA